MVTKEQAIEIVTKRFPFQNEYYSLEIHILSMEQATLPNDHRMHTELVSFKPECWLCTFEQRWKRGDAPWGAWTREECYVVEPELGPYVIGPFG